MEYEIGYGTGPCRLKLAADYFGGSLLVTIANENAHLGAVAVGEYSREHARSSISVITRLGHKDDELARRAAYKISRHRCRECCVVAGVHIDNITKQQMLEIEQNFDALLDQFIGLLSSIPDEPA